MSHRRILAVCALAAAIGLWWALGFWIPSGVERFYLVVPPVVAALAVLGSESPRRWLRSQGLFILGYLVFIVVASLASGYLRRVKELAATSW